MLQCSTDIQEESFWPEVSMNKAIGESWKESKIKSRKKKSGQYKLDAFFPPPLPKQQCSRGNSAEMNAKEGSIWW